MKVQKIHGLFRNQSLYYVVPSENFFQLLSSAVIKRGEYQNHIGLVWVLVIILKIHWSQPFLIPIRREYFCARYSNECR